MREARPLSLKWGCAPPPPPHVPASGSQTDSPQNASELCCWAAGPAGLTIRMRVDGEGCAMKGVFPCAGGGGGCMPLTLGQLQLACGGEGLSHLRVLPRGGGGRTRERSEAGCGRPEGGGGACAAKTVKRPPQQSAQPRYSNYRAPLTHKRHPPQPAQPQHTSDWAPRTRKRHQQEHRPQRPTERSDPTQHAKGRTGDCPGPRRGATTRRNVTRGAEADAVRWYGETERSSQELCSYLR